MTERYLYVVLSQWVRGKENKPPPCVRKEIYERNSIMKACVVLAMILKVNQ